MKRAALMFVILLMSLPSCMRRAEVPEELVVAAKGGLNLREKPDSKSARLFTVPDGATVSLLERTETVEKIGGIDGKWVKISWDGKTGYAFDRFLKPSGYVPRRAGCTPFMLYNIVCLPAGEAEDLAAKCLPPGPPGSMVLTPDLFSTPPPLSPGSEVLVLTVDGIAVERVSSLSIMRTAGGQDLMTFKLGKEYSGALYMSRGDIKSAGAAEPEIIRLSPVSDGSRAEALMSTVLSKARLPITFSEWSQDPGVIRKHYALTLSEAAPRGLGGKCEILRLVNLVKGGGYEYLAIFMDGRLSFHEFGYLKTVFSFQSKPYLALTRYTPHSGDSSAMLFVMEKGGLKEIQKDDRFGN